MTDILSEVYQEEMDNILKFFRTFEWPKHFLLWQFIKIMQEYKQNGNNITQKLFRYGEMCEGVYVLETQFKIRDRLEQQYFVYTVSADLSGLRTLLSETNILPWKSNGLLFEILVPKLTPIIMDVGAKKTDNLEVEKNIMMVLPWDTTVELETLPDDVYLKMLTEGDIPEVNKNWPFRFEGSDEFLGQELKNNFGIGLFRKYDDKLLSSSLSTHSGGIFVLHTDSEFRKKGYAAIIVKNMAVELRKRGNIPFCLILENNIPSQNLFRKLGFEEFTVIEWVFPSTYGQF